MKPIGRYTKGFDGKAVRIKYTFGSTNDKTGDVIQQWITPADWERDTQKEKIDVTDSTSVCNDCPLMKTCYVKKGHANMGLKSGAKSRNFKQAMETDLLKAFTQEFVRFGAFGEPVLAGAEATRKITNVAYNWTGYTHQWRNDEHLWSKKYFMASVEDAEAKQQANDKGYRTFRVGKSTDEILPDEVLCPASKEAGRKVTCKQCGLCKGASIQAKNVFIVKH